MSINPFDDDNGSFFVLHGLSTSQNFSKLFPVMQASMSSFARLTDASKINVKPDYLRVKKVAKAGTVAETFKALGVPADKYKEVAFLNNMELTDRLAAGQMIKIVSK